MKTFILSRDSREKYEERVFSNCKELRNEKVNLSHYIDPDKGIAEKKDINSKEIIIAPDGICSIKYLLRYYDGTDYSTPYSIIRNKLIVWPRHRQGINQRRYQVFRDRLDFTIYDIQQFYINGKRNSKLVIEDSDTAFYLKAIGSFANFIDEYDFQSFVDKSNKVINLATGCVITTYDEYGFSTEINANYLNGLIERLIIGND